MQSHELPAQFQWFSYPLKVTQQVFLQLGLSELEQMDSWVY